MKKQFAAVLLFLALQTVSTLAQSPAVSPTPPPNKGDVVIITTNLVQIDATVTDKDGKVVTNLTADDFELYQNGDLQPITNFSFVPLQSDDSAPNVTGEKNGQNVKNIPPTTPLRQEDVRRTIALVVDDLGLSFPSVAWTKQALKKFVDEQMQAGDLVAIIRTGSGIGALQQFTNDKRLLYAAIEKIRWNPRGRGGTSSFAPLEPTLSEQLSGVKDLSGDAPAEQNIAGRKEELEFNRDIVDAQENVFAIGTLGAVSYVMRGLGQLPGRKAIMLFSDGFKLFSRKGFSNRVVDGLQKLTDLANRSGVIIYTLDARGLDAPMLTAADDTFGKSSEQLEADLAQRRNDLLDTQQSLRYLADQTGGFAIINQNNISKGIQKILNDQKGYYLLGYQPDDEIFKIENRRYNKVVIKVKRPGLKIRFRSGFLGITDEEAAPKPKNPVQQLIAALTSPFAVKEIDVRMTPIFTGDAKTGSFVRTMLFVKGEDLRFTEGADGWHKAEFDVSIMTFGDNGEVVEQSNTKQTIRARAESLADIRQNGFVGQVLFPIKKPGAYQMRVALRDSQTSLIGSASQYIEIPNLKKNRLTLSGIVLQRGETKNENVVSDHQVMLKTHREAAMRRFRSAEAVRFALSVYNAKTDKSNSAPRLTLQYKIFRNSQELFASAEKPVTLGADLQNIDVFSGFTLGGAMPAGDYVLQVIVKDTLAKDKYAVANQWIDFEIVK